MPPYDFLAIQKTFLLYGIGLLVVLAVVLARLSRSHGFTSEKSTDRELEEDVHEFGGDVSEARRPVPWLIWLVFFGYFAWATLYVVWSGGHPV